MRSTRAADARENDARVTDATNCLQLLTEADHEYKATRFMAQAQVAARPEDATRYYTAAVAHLLMADRKKTR